MALRGKKEDIPRQIGDALENRDHSELRRLLVKHPQFLRFEDGRDRWLSLAAAWNDLDALKLLVELGLNVNDSSSLDYPATALHEAASEGHLEVVRWLNDHGAAIDEIRNGHPTGFVLGRAVRNGHFDIVKFLIERGADIHGHWHGVNALMDAEFYGHPEIAEYLRSLGAKDMRELTPPDYAGSSQRLIENMVARHGPMSDWSVELPGDPAITIHHIPADEKQHEPAMQTLFTIGLSDHRLPDPWDAFHCTELRLSLPPDWPLTEEALAEVRWNWPLEWLKRIAVELRDAEALANYPPLFTNGDPPQPLAEDTRLNTWIGLRSSSNHVQMPDNRWISLLDLYAVYAEESAFALEHGHEALALRFEERGVPLYVDPRRENVCA